MLHSPFKFFTFAKITYTRMLHFQMFLYKDFGYQFRTIYFVTAVGNEVDYFERVTN